MSPLESESRMAAQLAPFTIVELMPYFLKKPFSWAITMGEQSVSAIMPKRRSATSGPVPAVGPALAASLLGASLGSPPQAHCQGCGSNVRPVVSQELASTELWSPSLVAFVDGEEEVRLIRRMKDSGGFARAFLTGACRCL